MWASKKDSVQFGNTEIAEFIFFFFFFFFLSLLLNGGCKTDKVLSEWLTLKSYMCRLSQIIKI